MRIDMDCTFITGTFTTVKFNSIALQTLLATALSVAPDDVAISARWAKDVKPPAMPEQVMITIPDGTGYTCQQMGVYIKNNYTPTEDDAEEGQKTRRANLDNIMRQVSTVDGSLLKEILDRLKALEP